MPLNNSDLINLVNTTLINNTSGLINAPDMRNVLINIINSDANLISNNNVFGLNNYDSTRVYGSGGCVVNGGNVYQAIVSNTSIGSFNPTQWQQISTYFPTSLTNYILKTNGVELTTGKQIVVIPVDGSLMGLQTGYYQITASTVSTGLNKPYPETGSGLYTVFNSQYSSQSLDFYYPFNDQSYYYSKKSNGNWVRFNSVPTVTPAGVYLPLAGGIMDNTAVISSTSGSGVWVALSVLVNDSGQFTVDWNNSRLLNSGNFSIDWGNRLAYNNNNDITIDYQNDTLNTNSPSQISVDWGNRYTYDSGNFVSVDWGNRGLYDTTATKSIDWADRILIDNSSNNSINYNTRIIYDNSAISSIDYSNRLLKNNLNVVIGNWSGSNFLLNSDPVNPLEAATKHYVDSSISSIGTFLPLAGGTMTGNINMGTNKIQVSNIGNYFDLNNGQFWWSSSADVTIDMVNQTLYSTGYSHTSIDWHAENLQHVGTIIADWHTGYLTLNADPISNLGAATKHYVDSKTGSTSGIVFLTSIQTLTNKTISGSSNTLSNIANTSLVNSSITINGSSVSLGSSTTITANLNNALTVGTGLILNSGITFDGSSAKTLTIDSTVATLTGIQTLTNKTLTSPNINLGSDATGDIYYRNSTGNLSRLAIGTTGQVLEVSGGLPIWTTITGSGTVSNFVFTNNNGFTGTVTNSTTTPTLSLVLQNSTTSQSGQLTNTDWNTFNDKQSAISLTVNGSSGNATFISNTLNIPTYTLFGLGGLPVNNPNFTGTLQTGTLTYTDTNILESLQSSVNSYNQFIIQNSNSGATSSSDIIVSNDSGTATTYYGNFGINSSGYTGSGSFNLPNSVYLTSTTGDLVLGTTTSNTIHFVNNSATTDSFSISSTALTDGIGTLVGTKTTQNIYNTVATTINFGGATTNSTFGGTTTSSLTSNFFANATASGNTKNINIGTGGATGSTTNMYLGPQTGNGTLNVYLGSQNSTLQEVYVNLGSSTIKMWNTSSSVFDTIISPTGGGGSVNLCSSITANMGTIVIASGNAIQGSYAQPLVIQSSSSNNGIYLNKNTASSGNITITTGNSFVTQLWNEGNNSFSPTSGTGTLTWVNFQGTINQTSTATGYTRLMDFSNIVYSGVLGTHSQIYTNINASTTKNFINHQGTAASIHGGALSVGSTSQPNSSSVLQLTSASNNTGFGNVVMTTAQKLAITSPLTGLQVVSSDVTKSLDIFDGSRWKTAFRSLFNSATIVNNGSSETDAYSYTMPVNTMSQNLDTIIFDSEYTLNPGTTKEIRQYFNGGIVGDSGSVSVTGGGTASINTKIIRVSNTSVAISSTTTIVNSLNVVSTTKTHTTVSGLNLTTTTYIMKTTIQGATPVEISSFMGSIKIDYSI